MTLTRLHAVPALAVALVLSGCSASASVSVPTKVDKNDVAKDISAHVARVFDQPPPDKVVCPSDLEAKVGATLNCALTDMDFTYVTHVTVTSIDGGDVKYDIKVDEMPLP